MFLARFCKILNTNLHCTMLEGLSGLQVKTIKNCQKRSLKTINYHFHSGSNPYLSEQVMGIFNKSAERCLNQLRNSR